MLHLLQERVPGNWSVEMAIWGGFSEATRLEHDNGLISSGKWDNVNIFNKRTVI